MPVLCARCNAPITCTPEGSCWCMQLPPIHPMPSAEDAPGCLCPTCLAAPLPRVRRCRILESDMLTIRIGSRGSALALWQANHIADKLRSHGHTVEIQVIRTTGDRMQSPAFVPPATFDGAPLDSRGVFIKEIEDALAAGHIDLAVHSLKDLPTTLDPRFTLAAVPERADPRDVWVCEPYWALHTLPMHGRVGTTSPRRRAMLLALRPDLKFVEIRGNIDTRLRKLDEGEADALVLAAAGLDRLNRTSNVHSRFDPTELCPAPGQGALGLETRSPNHALDTEDRLRDPAILAAIQALNHRETGFAVRAERATLATLGGGCMLPVGCLCTVAAGTARVHAQVVAPDGEAMAIADLTAPETVDPLDLGCEVADLLIARGALDLLAHWTSPTELTEADTALTGAPEA